MTAPQRIDVPGWKGLSLAGDLWPAVGDRRGHVVLLHGGGQTRHSWATTGRRLSTQGWTAVSMDTRGHGDSAWAPVPTDYSMTAFVEDLRAVVDWIGEPPVVLGASLGGMTGMVAEGESPGLLRGLVLVDIVATIEAEGVEKITTFMRSGMNGFDTLEQAADAIAAYNPHRPRPSSLDGLRKNLRQRDDGRWHWHWDPVFLAQEDREADRGIRLERRREAASHITVPTLLVRGKHSDIVSPEGVRELLELVPGARYVDVAEAGHMVAGDDNDVFTAAVEGFLADLPPL